MAHRTIQVRDALPLLDAAERDLQQRESGSHREVEFLLARVRDALHVIRRYYYKHGKRQYPEQRIQLYAAICRAEDSIDGARHALMIEGNWQEAAARLPRAIHATRQALQKVS